RPRIGDDPPVRNPRAPRFVSTSLSNKSRFSERSRPMDMSRRHLIALGGMTLAGTALVPRVAGAQSTPKRGGTLTLRLWDPPHFDLQGPGGFSYKTQIPYSFTHSRLLKHKAGPSVVPGTFPIEGDLAESWSQPNEPTYIFKLRKGV